VALSMHDEMRRKGERDAARLAEKVREAVRKDIRKYITEEAVITSDGKRKVRIPIRGLRLPEFRFGGNEKGGGRLGSGRGEAQDGDRLVPSRGAQAAGQGAAEHILEKEVTIEELVEMAFEELGLPDLEEHAQARIRDRRRRWDEVRKTGPIAQVDLRRTLKANLARRAREGQGGHIGDVRREDLRFRSWTERVELANNAVIVSMMDVSGSMTEHKKWLVRMCLFWIKRYLERIYDGLAFVFIIHDTRAQVVDEELFFATTTGGGTYISSAYEKALEVVDREYPASDWNIYPFYFSDGENWEDDNKRAVVHARRLAERSRMFYYGQVASTNYATFMKTITEGLSDTGKLVVADIQGEKDVAEAIRRFLARDARLDDARRPGRGARSPWQRAVRQEAA
jgi:uncharacterized protein